ncbi:AraC family transcriptional regulator [Reyranella sp. CPCC 100927]|uniref:AraC family transcriptional regulator n=1 Tax=Reyranella sp. CPCC 100927 TaxID=2599616 RepID=UPI0011B80CB8|nr:AraC family transcriptional regulator [Reyranella sp. CPCC 100927]TWT14835.1 AraC family transcriptional regulator [Reyranella sp. CPCC 100927]
MSTRALNRDWARYRQPRRGVETLRAYFRAHAFDRHAHDTLAIGTTDTGVQRFRYRGQQHDSTTGGMIILHPGEPHDGECGAEDGFTYRMIYLDPGYGLDLLREAELGSHLPFAPEPLLRDAILRRSFSDLWDALGGEPGLRQDEALVRLWQTLARGLASGKAMSLAPDRLARVRDALADAPRRHWSLDELAGIAGISRFALCRAFRRAYGVSPYAYLLARRLAQAQRDLVAGMPAAEAAIAAGFVDQSHLTRNLKRRFGMSPGRFARVASGFPSVPGSPS